MALIKPTATGDNFLSKTATPADITSISAVQLYERQVGSDGATSNTVYSLSKYYLPGSHTLMVFLNGQKLEVDDEYTETNALTITFASALADADVIEFMVMGHYRVTDSELESALQDFPQDNNLLINGGFDVWQRGTTLALTTGAYYITDHWITYIGTGGVGTGSRQQFTYGQTDVPGEPNYYLQIDQTTGGTDPGVNQRVEDVRRCPEGYATFSFYAQVSSGTLSVTPAFRQNFGSGGSSNVDVSASAVTVTTAWQKFTVTFAIPSITGKTIGAGHYCNFRFNLPASTTFTLNIAQCKAEVGSVATPYVSRPIAQELALCQRYYQCSTPSVTNGTARHTQYGLYTYSVSSGRCQVPFPVQMRTSPTTTFYRTADGTTAGKGAVFVGSWQDLTGTTQSSTTVNGFVIEGSKASAFTAYETYLLSVGWSADAEL